MSTSGVEYKGRFQIYGLEGLKELPSSPKSDRHAKLLQCGPKDSKAGPATRCPGLRLATPPVESGSCLGLKCNHSEDSERARTGYLSCTLAGFGPQACREGDSADKGAGCLCREAGPLLPGRPCGARSSRRVTELGHFLWGRLKGVSRVYLHAVADTYGSHAFGFSGTSMQPEVAVLHNDALLFYAAHGLGVDAVLKDNGTECCGV